MKCILCEKDSGKFEFCADCWGKIDNESITSE